MNLLHNMSAPPKSVVTYAGLSALATKRQPGGSGLTSVSYAGTQSYGTALRFVLPEAFRGADAATVLALLGITPEPGRDPARQLIACIKRRALELPLPEGCAVIKAEKHHPVLWDDPLAALAVLTQSTDTVWLRGKSPTLSAASQRDTLSLLVPPTFVARLPHNLPSTP